ncbi:hypothetical protein [Aliiglaciecola sp. M165]|uniref:hypothetical protein n=1 Tax=Aliiglaciecola sp. M165 TaxID=2593649 RepID=UPI00117EC917|nr:hypothetical protein [Aliiglaciecola sp. M165]TRY28670.1 hypothetical protein FM019_20635 [Aliiglaciecola sp. M165]
MINQTENSLEWSTLLFELSDVVEHTQELIDEMNANGNIGEIEYGIQIAHIYAHLNRAWNTRNLSESVTDSNREALSGFPKDIEPL